MIAVNFLANDSYTPLWITYVIEVITQCYPIATEYITLAVEKITLAFVLYRKSTPSKLKKNSLHTSTVAESM